MVMLEFWSLVRGFEESIMGSKEEEYVMEKYDKYDRVWGEYVQKWNSSHSSFELKREAFGAWIIEGTIDVYVVTE